MINLLITCSPVYSRSQTAYNRALCWTICQLRYTLTSVVRELCVHPRMPPLLIRQLRNSLSPAWISHFLVASKIHRQVDLQESKHDTLPIDMSIISIIPLKLMIGEVSHMLETDYPTFPFQRITRTSRLSKYNLLRKCSGPCLQQGVFLLPSYARVQELVVDHNKRLNVGMKNMRPTGLGQGTKHPPTADLVPTYANWNFIGPSAVITDDFRRPVYSVTSWTSELCPSFMRIFFHSDL